jgi:hypothetical protein
VRVGRKATGLGGIEGFAWGESHRKPGCRKGDPAFLFGGQTWKKPKWDEIKGAIMIKKVSTRKWKIILIITAGILALLFLTSTTFKTPEIKGVVIDAETGQTIDDARIYAKWERRMRGFGGKYSAGIEKELRLKTSPDGTFLIPAHTLFNFIPSPIGIGGDFYTFVYSIGYKNAIFDFFEAKDFEGPPKPRYIEFDGVTRSKTVVLKLENIKDPELFIKNRREVSSRIQKGEDFRLKEDQFFVERFGKKRWNDRNIQYELADAYYRLSDYKSALRKLDEILEIDPTSKTKYFEEKYMKYKSKLTNSVNKKS